jgi:hypothetical protein
MQDHGAVAFSITAQAPRQPSCPVTNTLTNPGTDNQYTLEALTFGGISTNMWPPFNQNHPILVSDSSELL